MKTVFIMKKYLWAELIFLFCIVGLYFIIPDKTQKEGKAVRTAFNYYFGISNENVIFKDISVDKSLTEADTLKSFYSNFIKEYNDDIDIYKELCIKPLVRTTKLSHDELIFFTQDSIEYSYVHKKYNTEVIKSYLEDNKDKFTCYSNYLTTLEKHPERYKNIVITSFVIDFEVVTLTKSFLTSEKLKLI